MNFIIILMELFEIKFFTIAVIAITNVEPLFTDVAKSLIFVWFSLSRVVFFYSYLYLLNLFLGLHRTFSCSQHVCKNHVLLLSSNELCANNECCTYVYLFLLDRIFLDQYYMNDFFQAVIMSVLISNGVITNIFYLYFISRYFCLSLAILWHYYFMWLKFVFCPKWI